MTATKRIPAWEARRNFGEVLDEVESEDRPIIIESHGTARVTVVPIEVVEAFEADRRAFFDLMDRLSANADLSEEDAMTLANDEIAAARQELRARTLRADRTK